MKSNLNAIDTVFSILNSSPLKNLISGRVAKNVRPTNSVSEDIVINALPVNNSQLQRGIINVNIHVPNMIINTGGITDRATPDHNRLSQLTEMAIPVLKDVWGSDWDIDIEQINLIREETSSFNNIRIIYQAINV